MSDAKTGNEKPRIALLCHSLIGAGGTERVVSTLSSILSQRFDIYEFSFDLPGSTRYFDSPARFLPLGRSLQLPLFLRPISYALDAFRLWRAKRRLGISLTISNLWRADLLSVLSMGADRKVSICHINIIGNATNRLLLNFRGLVSLVYGSFDRVVSVSRPLGEEIRSLFRLEKAKTVVIHNCVPFRNVEPHRDAHQRTRIAWCGRFVAEKNVLTLVEIFAGALKCNTALQLILIGDGPVRQQAEALIERLGLGVGDSIDDEFADVVLTGFLFDPILTIAQCDFQVLPSIAEGFGLVLVEGFSVRVPALASDCSGGGVHDAMGGTAPYSPGRQAPEQTDCGFLLPVPDATSPKSMDVWRAHILLMAANVELRERLAEWAEKRARLFLPEAIAPKWFQLIDEML